MTKIACKLVLNAGTIRLVWRSIKSLKNIHGDGSTVTERTIARDGSKNIPALRNGWQRQSSDGAMDEEILQLWSLLACHQALCVYLPFEAIMSTFIPFYFHIKFLVLLITFIPGTKFPNFWFYTVLVPGMDYVHDLLDVDYRYVIQSMVDEIHALPLQLIDLLFLPGQFWDFGEPRCYGAYVSEKKQQSEQSGMTFGNVQPPEILSNKCDDLHVATNIGRNLEKTTAKSAIEGEDNLSATSVEEILIDLDLSAEEESQMSERENEGTVNSGVVKRRSSKDLGVNISTSVDGSRRRSVSLVGKPTISRTMWRPRQSLDESTLGSRRNLHQFGRQPLFSFAKSSGITSPVAQSRLHASSLHLRKFSKDHENANVKKSPTKVDMNTTQRKPLREFVSEVVDPFNNAVAWDTVSGKENGSEASISTTSSPARSLRSIVQEMQSTPPAGARRSSRPSLGDNLRTMLTGDYHIRIRDYLFDLDLPHAPTPIGSPNPSYDFENVHPSSISSKTPERVPCQADSCCSSLSAFGDFDERRRRAQHEIRKDFESDSNDDFFGSDNGGSLPRKRSIDWNSGARNATFSPAPNVSIRRSARLRSKASNK